ncbi:MAG TPA: metallophosphoesterase family protein [Streptosporangiaceae bacterium]|nr:metallophosphoesterase family protein [Streptosporangiaceae bacterium]
MPDQIAIISDVHGNVTALEAVLADIRARGITRIVNLGDVVGKGPRGSDAIRLTRAACEVSVRGNWDSFIARDARLPFDIGQWTRDSLSDHDLAWLAALPGTFELVMSGRRIRLFHASQAGEHVRVRRRHTPGQFRAMFTNTEFTGPFLAGAAGSGATPDVVGYGDIHAAYLEMRDGLTLFNVGATGNPLDDPCAPYVVLEGAAGSQDPAPFSVQFTRVPYDIEAEIAVARKLGMPEADAYAGELRDGIYRGARSQTAPSKSTQARPRRST